MTADGPLEFLDTNVVVYAHDTSAEQKHTVAYDLLDRVTADRTGRLSVQVLQEFFVTVTQKIPRPLSVDDATAIVTDLSDLPVHASTSGDLLDAIQIHQQHGISFWDAMIVRSATQLGCEVLWSED